MVRRLLLTALERVNADLPLEVCDRVVEASVADLVGYGPLELLLGDVEISEIMINGSKSVFVERNGELLETMVIGKCKGLSLLIFH